MGLSKRNIPIPRRSAVCEMLAKNGLIGKIHLVSTMNEEAIMREIQSVFNNAMQNNEEFTFQILQPAGGVCKSLIIPSLSHSFSWTASAVAGRNAKNPICILALDELKVCLLLCLLDCIYLYQLIVDR